MAHSIVEAVFEHAQRQPEQTALFFADQSQCIEKNPNMVYGKGFRHVRAIAERVGFDRLLEVLRTRKHMPN